MVYLKYTIVIIWALIELNMPAYALELPNLVPDPFATQKKLAPYGANLKPASCPNKPDTSKPLALNEVVITTLCYNPDTRSAYLNLLAQADSYDSTIISYLPDITANATGSSVKQFHSDNFTIFGNTGKFSNISRGSSASAQAGMVLYDFGRREVTLDIAERTLVAAGLSYDSTLQGFIAASLQNYFQLLTAQNALDIEHESYLLAKATLDAAELRYKLGIAPLSDVLQARASFSQTELALKTAENTVALDKGILAQSMGFPPLTELSVKDVDDTNLMHAPFNSPLAELIEKAKDRRVDLKASRLQLKNAEDNLKITQKRGLPSITASASSSYSDWNILDTDTTRNDSIGVSVTIPIFTGFGRIVAERSERKQVEAQREQLLQNERNVEQDVLRTWHNYTTSSKSFEISFDSLSTAEELKNVALGRYKEGLGSILEVLNAQVQFRNAQQSHLQTRYNLLTTRVDLVRSVGVLSLDNAINPTTEDDNAVIIPEATPVLTKEPADETP